MTASSNAFIKRYSSIVGLPYCVLLRKMAHQMMSSHSAMRSSDLGMFYSEVRPQSALFTRAYITPTPILSAYLKRWIRMSQ